MNYKKILAAVMAAALAAGFTGCGKDDTTENSGADKPVVSDTSETGDETSKKPDSSEKDDKDDKDSNKDTDKDTEKPTSADDKSQADPKPTSASGNSGGGSGNSGGSSSDNNSGGGSGSSGDNSGSGGNSGGSGGSEGGDAPEEKVYTAEITLGSTNKVTGSNASVNGKYVTITGAGDYRIKGKAGDVQVLVKAEKQDEEKITLVLDGVDIACSDGPAINIQEAKRCTVKLADGSSNYLRDGGTGKIEDGVIFSNDTLRIKGDGGYLEINSGNAHGIASDDDVIIEGGRIKITSIKSGIFAHDDITINGGELTVFGGTNGMKSKGTINVNGGKSIISGGVKEEKSSIHAKAGFYYTDGEVYAAGNKVTAPGNTPNPYVVGTFGDYGPAGADVKVYFNGSEQVSFKPHNDFRCLLVLSPSLSNGTVFKATINGNSSSDYTLSGGQNMVEIG